jgi:hypothetical protein
VRQADSALFLSIQAVDRSVHIKKSFDLPVSASLADNSDQQALLADMFALDQQPAVVFATNLIISDCRDAANVGHPACTAEAQGRRRRLQKAACPAAEFIRRDTELRETCGLAADLTPADAALSGACPSALCAGALVTMLTDCAEAVEHGQRCTGVVCSGIAPAQQAFYQVPHCRCVSDRVKDSDA